VLGVMLSQVYPVARGADTVPAAAETKPKTIDGSQWSPDLKPALSPPVLGQALGHDSS